MTPRGKALLDAVLDSQASGELAVTGITADYVHTDDFLDDREIRYRISPVTKSWAKSLFHAPSRKTAAMLRPIRDNLADMLSGLDEDMLRTVRGIWFVSSDADMETMLRKLGMEEWEAPGCIDPGHGCLGCHWFAQSLVVVDLAAIGNVAAEMARQAEAAGEYLNEASEFDAGVYVTVAHELYHAAESDPFLDLPAGEEEAERYGRDAYENWLYGK